VFQVVFVANNLHISGLTNEPFFTDGLYDMPDAIDAGITEIESNVMEAIGGGALQGDAIEAIALQDDLMEANTFYAGTFDADDYSDEDTLEDNVLETASQSKKPLSPPRFAPRIY